MADPVSSRFLSQPAEILTHILEFLPPQDLSVLSTTCRLLHTHGQSEVLWAQHVRRSVSIPLSSPSPCSSWRDLYIVHHPFWFIPRYKIWFADRENAGNTMTGSLIIARFDPRRGCIEGYRLMAEHGKNTFESWDYRPDVIIHTFNPKVHLWLDDPIVKLDIGVAGRNAASPLRIREETTMKNAAGDGITAKISLCQAIPPALQYRSMALWPPERVPARQRVRCESSSMFRDAAHKPRNLAQASDQTFRIRKYLDFRGMEGHLGVRLGEDVMTFSTLLEESYTPTRQRPWQGIWVGDYSAHGCEFLLVLQKDVDRGLRPIRASRWSSFSSASSTSTTGDHNSDDSSPSDNAPASLLDSISTNTDSFASTPANEVLDDNPVPSCRGRLEAIKLTGDPNVPRGEYTWIAEDIGPTGFIRNANEQMFNGARVVRSLGHCAARNFKHGISPLP